MIDDQALAEAPNMEIEKLAELASGYESVIKFTFPILAGQVKERRGIHF